MDPDSRRRIQLNYLDLVNNIDVVLSGLGDILFQMGVIDDEEHEMVTMVGCTMRAHVRTLLRILRQNGNAGTFAKFCEALEKSGYTYLAENLRNRDVAEVVLDKIDGKNNRSSLIEMISKQSEYLISIRDEHMSKIALLEEENKRLLEERGKTVDAAKNVGIMDENFVDLFVGFGAGESVATQQPFRNIQELTLTWENLTACRLSIDIVQYVVAICANKQPSEPFNDVSVSLRRIVDGMLSNSNYKVVFEEALQSLDVREIEGYATLTAIADELFIGDSWNWGRVITWYAFCAYVAGGFHSSTVQATLDMYGTYNWFFLHQRFSKEISEAGGWRAFLKYLENFNHKEKKEWNMAPVVTAISSLLFILWSLTRF